MLQLIGVFGDHRFWTKPDIISYDIVTTIVLHLNLPYYENQTTFCNVFGYRLGLIAPQEGLCLVVISNSCTDLNLDAIFNPGRQALAEAGRDPALVSQARVPTE